MSPELWFPSGKERVFVLCPLHSWEARVYTLHLLVRYCLLRANLRVWSISEEWIQFCDIFADQWRALVTTVMNLRRTKRERNLCIRIFWLIQVSLLGLGHVNAVPFCAVGHEGTRSQGRSDSNRRKVFPLNAMDIANKCIVLFVYWRILAEYFIYLMMILNWIGDMAFDGRIICELWIVKDVKGGGRGIF